MPLFVDTNVLLYAVSRVAAEREKALVARGLLRRDDLAFSTQVLQEFYVQATRPTREQRISHAQAVGVIRALRRFPVQETTQAIVDAALTTCERFRISYWDAAILEAARALGCDDVLSEDLADDQDYGGISVTNPFRPGHRFTLN